MEEINSDKELNLKVRLEINDIKTCYYWIEKNDFFKRPTTVMVLFLVMMSIVREIMSIILQGRIYINVYAHKLIILVGILFLLTRGIWRFIYINKIAKKFFDSDKIIQKEQRFKITNTTIIIKYGESISKISWEEIYRVHETEKQFLIFTAINKPLVIPKRFIEKNEDISLLRGFSKKVAESASTCLHRGAKLKMGVFGKVLIRLGVFFVMCVMCVIFVSIFVFLSEFIYFNNIKIK